MRDAIIIVLSYFLGSMPFGFIVAKSWRGVDIRKCGSGNIGATNVLRTLGRGPAVVVFVADVLKGLIPVLAAKGFFPDKAWLAVLCGMAAILGHTFSVFLKLRGGKGVATSLGVIIGLEPVVAGIGFGVWLVVVALTRYVSAASIAASVSIPVLMWMTGAPIEYKVFGLVAGAFVIVKHRENIVRLLRGEEPRFGQGINASEG